MEDTKTHVPAQTPDEWFRGHAHQVKSPKISHALINPGVTIEQALAKTSLKDTDHLNSLLFLLAELELYGCTINSPAPLDTVPRMVLRQIIGLNSVGGKARLEAIESDIGIIDQAAHQSYITGKPSSLDAKTKKGILRKDDKKEQQSGNGN